MVFGDRSKTGLSNGQTQYVNAKTDAFEWLLDVGENGTFKFEDSPEEYTYSVHKRAMSYEIIEKVEHDRRAHTWTPTRALINGIERYSE